MRQAAILASILVVSCQVHAQDRVAENVASGLIGLPELVEHELFVPATFRDTDVIVGPQEGSWLADFDNDLRVSFSGLVGRRVFDPSKMDQYESDSGLLLAIEKRFRDRSIGFDGWESNVAWIQSDTYGIAESASSITVNNLTTGPGQITRVVRWETYGDQVFASTDLNLYRDVWSGDENPWNISGLAGVRYLFSDEDYETELSSNSVGASFDPYSGYQLTNHLLGPQVGLRGRWSAERYALSSRVVFGLMNNEIRVRDRSVAILAPSLSSSSHTWAERTTNERRLSSLLEAQLDFSYRSNGSV